MIAIPSVAMDVYNDFFSTHDLTHFCQISLLKRIIHCPYQEQLSIVMENDLLTRHLQRVAVRDGGYRFSRTCSRPLRRSYAGS